MNNLDVLMNAVLARLELASHTAAANTDGNVSHGKSDGNQPPRVSVTHLHLRRAYSAARSDVERRRVIGEALDELRSIRYSRRSGVDKETKEGRLVIGRDPRTVRNLVYVYGYSERHIHRLRAEARAHDARSVRRPGTLT